MSDVLGLIARLVDDMEGQEVCCVCGERLTMDAPQAGHSAECSYAALRDVNHQGAVEEVARLREAIGGHRAEFAGPGAPWPRDERLWAALGGQ